MLLIEELTAITEKNLGKLLKHLIIPYFVSKVRLVRFKSNVIINLVGGSVRARDQGHLKEVSGFLYVICVVEHFGNRILEESNKVIQNLAY